MFRLPKTVRWSFVAGLFAVNASFAQTFIWTGATDGNWATAGNWDAGVPASGTSTAVVFDTATQLATTNDILGGLTLNSLLFGEDAGARTIAGSALIFDGTNPTLVTQSTDSGDIIITAPITLNQTLAITGGPSVDAQLLFNAGSSFSGTGGIQWLGGRGFINVAGTFSGGVTVTGGALGTNKSDGFGTNPSVTVASGGTVQLQGAAAMNKALSLSGGGFDTHAALESATGNGTWSGAIALGASATVGAINNSTLTISGTTALGAHILTADVSTGATVTIPGAISGTGGVTKLGAGALNLSSASSSYTGATLISAGVARAFHANAFGATSGVTVAAGAELQVAAATLAKALSLSGTLSGVSGASSAWSGAITLGDDATFGANGGTLNVTGGVNLNGSTLTLAPASGGSNIVRISSAVTGTGGLAVVNPDSGTVELAGGGVSTFTGPVSVTGTVSLNLGDNFGDLANTVTFAADAIVKFTNSATVGARPWVIDGSGGLSIVPSGLSSTIGASISGAAPLTVTAVGIGTGGLITLTGNNTFSGGLNVGSTSTVLAAADTALGVAGGAINLSSGGGLSALGDITLGATRTITLGSGGGKLSAPVGVTATVDSSLAGAGALTLGGGVGGNIGGTLVLAGTNTNSGGITVNGARLAIDSDVRLGDPAGALNFSGANELKALGNFTVAATRSTTFSNLVVDTNGFDVAFAQALTGTGIEKKGAGVLRFDAANASTSGHLVLVNAGTLRAGVADAFGTRANVSVAEGAAFDLNGFNHQVGSISGAGGVTLGGGTLTIRSGGNHAGAISGAGALVVENSASQILTGENTFEGGITVTGGANLIINGTTALGAAGNSVTLDDGGLGAHPEGTAVVIDASMPLTIGAGGARFSASSQSVIIERQLTGAISLGFSGGDASGGEVRLAHVNNTFVSAVNVGGNASDAVLGIVADGSLGDAANVLTLGSQFYNGESTNTGTGTLRAFGTVTLPATRTVRIDGHNGDGGGVIDTNGFAVVVDSAITELHTGVGLQKVGAGALLLNGANTFTGDTYVQAGTLGGNGSLGGNVTIDFGATLAPGASAGTFTIAGDLTLGGGSMMLFELGGTTPGVGGYDVVNVGGTAYLDGMLTISLIGGFDPLTGNSFQLFNAASFSGTFAAIDLPTLTGGLAWDTSQLESAGLLAVSGSAVPEPGTWALLAGVGALGAAIYRRRVADVMRL